MIVMGAILFFVAFGFLWIGVAVGREHGAREMLERLQEQAPDEDERFYHTGWTRIESEQAPEGVFTDTTKQANEG